MSAYTPTIERQIHSGMTWQRIFEFSNGYSASVVCGPYTYGGPSGLFELAVLYGNDIVYDTPVTSDVEGYLSEYDVQALLARIEALPTREVSA